MQIETHNHGPETEKINHGREFLKSFNPILPSNQSHAILWQTQKHCKVDYVKIVNDDDEKL